MQDVLEKVVRNLGSAGVGILKWGYDSDEDIITTEIVPIQNIIFPRVPNPKKLSYVIQYVEYTVAELCYKFPDKAQEIKKAAGVSYEDEARGMLTTIRTKEYWEPDFVAFIF